MTAVVDDAVAALERQRFFDAFNAGYGSLRTGDVAWSEIEAERALEERALRDGG